MSERAGPSVGCPSVGSRVSGTPSAVTIILSEAADSRFSVIETRNALGDRVDVRAILQALAGDAHEAGASVDFTARP